MAGVISDIEKLEKLQVIDCAIEDDVEKYNNSPIAKKIAEVRSKKSEIKAKRDKVDKIFVKTRTELQLISDKDSMLASSQDKVESEIKEISGDYRKVEAHTQKLNEITEQRKSLDLKIEQIESDFNKIKQVKEKIDTAIEKLSMAEDTLNEKLEKTNVNLKLELDKLQQDKAKLESEISEDVLKLYKKQRSICGKIVMAKVENSSCSVCRSMFSNANLSKIKKQAPLSTCPNCYRVLVVN